MNHDIRVLNDEEILSVAGGENSHGGHDGTGGGKGDGLGQLRQFEGALLGALVSAGKAIASIL
jgi:hypothetical protein